MTKMYYWRGYKEHKPDGVLLGITMPKMDGIVTATRDKKICPRCPGSDGHCHGLAGYGDERFQFTK